MHFFTDPAVHMDGQDRGVVNSFLDWASNIGFSTSQDTTNQSNRFSFCFRFLTSLNSFGILRLAKKCFRTSFTWLPPARIKALLTKLGLIIPSIASMTQTVAFDLLAHA